MDATEATAGEAAIDENGDFLRDQRPLSEYIKERPLIALAIGALAGFVAGGGAWTRAGLATMMLVGRISARQMAVGAIAKAVQNYGSARRSGAY